MVTEIEEYLQVLKASSIRGGEGEEQDSFFRSILNVKVERSEAQVLAEEKSKDEELQVLRESKEQ